MLHSYWRQAPREVGRRCRQAIGVPGLGPSCRSADGLWRLRLKDGSTVTTHGPDATPEPGGAAYYGGDPASVLSASVADIACVDTATTKYTALIYAHPSSFASRYATIAPLLREAAYGASAFLDAETKVVDPSKGTKLQMACDEFGVPIVYEASLPTSSAVDSFSTIVSDLRAQGYGTSSSSAALDRYLVFYDDTVSSGAAGTGHLYTSSYSDVTNSTSSNNRGGSFAVEFRWNNEPHWDILLHEAGHNMGAVQDSAPHTSGAGHCNDGLDLMCYNDYGPYANYNSGVCATEVFDCGRDDYFNPTPDPGSYFDTHWNVAANYNLFLTHLKNDAIDDSQAPTTPPSGWATYVTSSGMSLAWGASTDDIAVSGYNIYDYAQGEYTLRDSTASSPYAVTGLAPNTTYSFGISAFDAAGNESAKRLVTQATLAMDDTTAPSSPTDWTVTRASTSALLGWTASIDDVEVAHYNIYKTDSLMLSQTFVDQVAAPGYQLTGLAPSTTYYYALEAVDTSGNYSDMALVTFTTLRDSTAPTAPGNLRVSQRTRTSLTIAWNASTDNIGVYRYRVYRYTSSGWKHIGTTTVATRMYRNSMLTPGRAYAYRVRAVDAAGNLSGWSRTLSARTAA